MAIKIIDCEQGTPEWFRARMAMPTASKMATIMSSSSGRGVMPIRTRYLYELASEIITGEPIPEGFKSAAMERGNAMEPEALSTYSIITNHDLQRVGLVTNDSLIKGRTIGASPDALIDGDGGVEMKTQQPDLLIHRMLGNNDIPSEHLDQIQGIIWVCELKWLDIAVFWPKLPLFRRTVKRDEMHIKRLEAGVTTFFEDLDEVVEKIRKLGKGQS